MNNPAHGDTSQMYIRILLIFTALIHLCYLPICEAASLINVPLNPQLSDFNSETYRFIERLLNKRVVSGVTRGSLPFTRKQVTSILLEVSQKLEKGEVTLSDNDQKRLNELLAFYSESGTGVPPDQRLHLFSVSDDVSYRVSVDARLGQQIITRLVDNVSEAATEEGTLHVTTLYPHIYGQFEENFAFSGDMAYRSLYGDFFSDVYADESKQRQFEGKLRNRLANNNYLKFKLPWFELQFGHDNIQWGPGYHGNLLISSNPIAMDLVKFQTSFKNTSFTAFTGVLEDMSEDINDKYISGHRIEGYYWNRVGFGLSEVVVYGNRFEPGYLNPVNVYFINEQTISRADSRAPGSGDNLLMSADMRVRISDDFEIYGEVMVDDGNPAVSLKNWDTKLGILGGIYLTDPFGFEDVDLHIEYAFINQYAYTHVNPVNVYKHFTSVIGHHIGTDADNLWIEFRRRFTDKLETVFGYELERHGEGDIDKNHPADAPKDDVWTPLSGITASQHRLKVGFNWVDIGDYSFYGEWNRIWRRNLGNREGVHETGNEIQAKALYRF